MIDFEKKISTEIVRKSKNRTISVLLEGILLFEPSFKSGFSYFYNSRIKLSMTFVPRFSPIIFLHIVSLRDVMVPLDRPNSEAI